MFSPESLPVAGGTFLAGLLYAGVSMFITGPMIGERMVERLEWGSQCARYIEAEHADAEAPVSVAPKIDCNSIFMIFGREGEEFCAVHGDTIDNNPISKSIEAAENAKRELQSKRMELAAERADSRCDCAVSTTLEQRRVQFAVFAASARAIEPTSVRMLESDLVTSLNSAPCAMRGV